MGEKYPFKLGYTMQISTIEERNETSALLAARIGHTKFERHLVRPRRQPGFTLLAEHEAQLVGYALLAHTRRLLGAATIDLAELALEADTAAVHEALLGAAVAAAAAAELPWLRVISPPQQLAAFGLVPCALQCSVEPPREARPATSVRLPRPDDLEDLDALAASMATWRLALRRTLPDWRWELETPAGWLVAEDARGRVVGYAFADRNTVVEAAAVDAGAARSLVIALDAAGLNRLALPLQHPVARAALMLGGRAHTRQPPANAPAELYGLVTLAAALAAIVPELERRLGQSRYAGWTGLVRLEGDAGSVNLCSEQGRLSVAPGSGPVDVAVRELELGAATQLLLGYRSCADLRATGELRCADVDLGLLDSLFPAEAP